MAILPVIPMVYGPLSICSRNVHIGNLVPGATVEIFANGTSVGGGKAAEPDDHIPLIASLPLHSKVTARQTLNGVTSDPTPNPFAVIVNQIGNLKDAVPAVPYRACGEMVIVEQVPAGAAITASFGGKELARTIADDGNAFLHLSTPLKLGESITLTQSTCDGATHSQQLPPPEPTILNPYPPHVQGTLRACMTAINLDMILPSARVLIQSSSGWVEGWYTSGNQLQATVPALISGTTLTISQRDEGCGERIQAASVQVSVLPASKPPAPILPKHICPGTPGQVVLQGLEVGATVDLHINGQAQTFVANYTTQFIVLNALQPDTVLFAQQSLCGISSDPSQPVIVDHQDLPKTNPSIPYPVFECARVIRVSNVEPGDFVQIISSKLGGQIGHKVAQANYVDIPISAPINAKDPIYAQAIGCGQVVNSALVFVQNAIPPFAPHVPTIPADSLLQGMRSFPVNDVIPGATLEVFLNDVPETAQIVGGPTTCVVLNNPLRYNDKLQIRQWLCSESSNFTQVNIMEEPPSSVITQHNDISRTGANPKEIILTKELVDVQNQSFGLVARLYVEGQIYAQPLVLSGLDLPTIGKRNIVYVATMHNHVYAFDADDYTLYWEQILEPFVHLPNVDIGPTAWWSAGLVSDYHDIDDAIGIVSTPVIDLERGALYLVTFTKHASHDYRHYLHALDLKTGAEMFSGPQQILTPDGTYHGNWYNQRAALLEMQGKIYVAFASYGDRANYHGLILSYDASTLAPISNYNVTPTGIKGGIWMAGQGPAGDGNYVYIMTGNGTTDEANLDLSCAFVRLDQNTLAVSGWFAPTNWKHLADDMVDLDLGSGGVLIIPDSGYMCGGGKEGKLYLLMCDFLPDIADDSRAVQLFQATASKNAPNPPIPPAPMGVHHIHGSPVYWNGPMGPYIYLWGESDFLRAFAFDPTWGAGRFNPNPISMSTMTTPANSMPGGMLSLSANRNQPGTGVLWASHPIKGDANQKTVAGIIRAIDAEDVSIELWNSEMNSTDSVGLFAKFCCPTIANGKVYLATFSGYIAVYGILT